MLTAVPKVSEHPRRKVCFPSLDWKEEESRTERGVKSRRKQKEEKKLRKMSAELVYAVLMNADNHVALTRVAATSRAFRVFFSLVYESLRSEFPNAFSPPDRVSYRRLIRRAQVANVGFESLNEDSREGLRGMGGILAFQPFLFAAVSSDSE
jgi:hypothetical protein